MSPLAHLRWVVHSLILSVGQHALGYVDFSSVIYVSCICAQPRMHWCNFFCFKEASTASAMTGVAMLLWTESTCLLWAENRVYNARNLASKQVRVSHSDIVWCVLCDGTIVDTFSYFVWLQHFFGHWCYKCTEKSVSSTAQSLDWTECHWFVFSFQCAHVDPLMGPVSTWLGSGPTWKLLIDDANEWKWVEQRIWKHEKNRLGALYQQCSGLTE